VEFIKTIPPSSSENMEATFYVDYREAVDPLQEQLDMIQSIMDSEKEDHLKKVATQTRIRNELMKSS